MDNGRRKEPAHNAAQKLKELTDDEEAKLKELKETLENELLPRHTDAILIGFLRARSFNVEDAVKLFYLDINYRKFLGIDNILDEEIPKLQDTYKMTGFIGFDKEGSVVRIVNIGDIDYKGLVHSLSTIQMLKIFLALYEQDTKRLFENNKKHGLKQERHVFILNLENLSMNQLLYKPVLDCSFLGLKLLQELYGDIIKDCFIINAPSFFSTIFKMFKPILQEHLVKRLRIFEADGWQEELRKRIDPDELPVYLGGNKLDINNDPKCSEYIGYGGTIDESYYAKEEVFLDPDEEGVITATVPAGSFLNYRWKIPYIGTVVKWKVQAKDNDIGIGLYCEPLDAESENTKSKKSKEEDMSKLEPLTPIIRSQCQLVPECGEAVIWKQMTLIFHLDNSYSWMNAKIVNFKVVLEFPPGIDKDPNEIILNPEVSIGKMNITSKDN